MAGDLVEELITIGGKDLGAFREKYILAGDLNETSVTAMFSSIPNHASPLSVNLMSNAILGTTQGSKGYRIEVTTHPLQSGLTTVRFSGNQLLGKKWNPCFVFTAFGTGQSESSIFNGGSDFVWSITTNWSLPFCCFLHCISCGRKIVQGMSTVWDGS